MKTIKNTLTIALILFIMLFSISFAETVDNSKTAIQDLGQRVEELEKINVVTDEVKRDTAIFDATNSAISSINNTIIFFSGAVGILVTLLSIIGTVVIPNQAYKREQQRLKDIADKQKEIKEELDKKIVTIEQKYEDMTQKYNEIQNALEQVTQSVEQSQKSAEEAEKSKEIIELWSEAFTHHQEKDYVIAKELYEKLHHLDPNNTNIHNNLGIIYIKLGQYHKAVELYEQAVELNDKEYRLYNNLGSAYRGLKDYKNAFKAYNKSKDLNPNNADVYSNLGIAYQEKKQFDEAFKMHFKALELRSSDGELYHNLACTYALRWQGSDKENCYKNIELALQYGLDLKYILEESDFEHIKDEKRFIKLVNPSVSKLAAASKMEVSED